MATKEAPRPRGKVVMDTTESSAHNDRMAADTPTSRVRWSRNFWLVVAVLAICAGWCLLSQVPLIPGMRGPVFLGPDGFLSFLERPTIDARFAFRGEIPSPLNVVYVDVDSDSLSELGNFPWNREIFARVLDALFRFGRIRAIGFDFVFSSAGIPNLGRAEAEQGMLALGRSIREHRAVAVAASYSSGLGPLGKRRGFPFLFDRRINPSNADLPELPEFFVVGPWGRIGLIDVVRDDVRNVPMFALTEHQTYLAMALQLALLHYGLPERAVEIGNESIVLRSDKGEAARIPLWQRQLVEPNWFSAWISKQNPRAGVSTVLDCARAMEEGSPEAKAEAAQFFSAFRDAIVLVGPTDPLLKDVTEAPLSNGLIPRVSLHGNMLKTIVGNRFIKRLHWGANVALITLLGLSVAALFVVDRRRLRGGKIFAVLLVALHAGAAFALFATADLLIPLVAPLGCALSCTLVAVLAKLGAEEKKRRRIKNLFGSYVSSSVVEEIMEKDILPQTGGAEVEVTAFFSDIASFTTLSETMSPTELVDVMCEYFAEGTKAVTEAGGTLDKYVGDAIIAMFGAPLQRPDHAAAACRAALALQDAQTMLRQRWTQSGQRWPAEVLDMRTRVGLNTGRAVVGNIGSTLRFNYTMMGAAVNLAQRMETAASHYGCGILVSSSTAEAARRDDPQLVFRELDRIAVAGLEASVCVFELIGSAESSRADLRGLLDNYAAGLALYREGRWREAADAFLSASGHESPDRGKNPSVVMASRCESFALEGRTNEQIFRLTKG